MLYCSNYVCNLFSGVAIIPGIRPIWEVITTGVFDLYGKLLPSGYSTYVGSYYYRGIRPIWEVLLPGYSTYMGSYLMPRTLALGPICHYRKLSGTIKYLKNGDIVTDPGSFVVNAIISAITVASSKEKYEENIEMV